MRHESRDDSTSVRSCNLVSSPSFDFFSSLRSTLLHVRKAYSESHGQNCHFEVSERALSDISYSAASTPIRCRWSFLLSPSSSVPTVVRPLKTGQPHFP